MKKTFVILVLLLLCGAGGGAYFMKQSGMSIDDFIGSKPLTPEEMRAAEEKKAETGNPDVQYQMAVNYRMGIYGYPKDEKKSMEWLKRAARSGSSFAQNDLGVLWQNGGETMEDSNGTVTSPLRKDAKQGEIWLDQAAQSNDTFALANLCGQYAIGNAHQAAQPEKAPEYCEKAISFGDVNSMVMLGDLYRRGAGVEKNLQKALNYFLEAASKGSAQGAMMAAYCYEQGVGGPADYKEAMKWYQFALDKGSAAARVNIGFLHFYGLGTAQDEQKGFAMMTESLKAGGDREWAIVTKVVTSTLRAHMPISSDAMKVYMAATKAHQPKDDAYALAQLYETGKGIRYLPEDAGKWYRIAADKKHPDAQGRLKDAEDLCFGVKKGATPNEQLQNCLVSAGGGSIAAQSRVADIYMRDTSSPLNRVQSYAWYTEVAENKKSAGWALEHAREKLQMLGGLLSDVEKKYAPSYGPRSDARFYCLVAPPTEN